MLPSHTRHTKSFDCAIYSMTWVTCNPSHLFYLATTSLPSCSHKMLNFTCIIEVVYCPTDEMVADIFMKRLA
ncbi:hypothetical protein Hypma_003475 [Hypsizygus marmoreus]|uniref:Uncharacterized protein n=1 Tax=Hypsizygus marmoreus TaxID=39966 RepID=A0A369J644_HYPMA|nr:hypothetical protein Hypma_003475 [Hypsizygus marmoreus]